MNKLFLISLSLLLTSCIKQEIFKPKHQNGKEILVISVELKPNKIIGELYALSAKGEKRYLGPGDIDFRLIENDTISFNGITSNSKGFIGFTGIQKPIENAKYLLKVSYLGKTIDFNTIFSAIENDISLNLLYKPNGHVSPSIIAPNTDNEFIYIIPKQNQIILNNYPYEVERNLILQNSGKLEIEPENKCAFFPFQKLSKKQSIFKIIAKDHERISENNRIGTDRNNPFFIPYTTASYFKEVNIYGGIYAINETIINYEIQDQSEIAFDLHLNTSGGDLINLNDSNYILYEVQVNKIKEGYHSRVGLFRVLENNGYSVPISYNKLLKDKCHLDNVLKSDLGNSKMYVFGRVKDKSNNGFKTDTVYFSGDNIPKKITLKIND